MNHQEYTQKYGLQPINDDLDRVNCNEVGEVGHSQCGECPEHHKPRFMCGFGCLASKKDSK